MTHLALSRAWKDPIFRDSLDPALLATLPENPAGPFELADREIDEASGFDIVGVPITTAITCTEYTWRGWRSCCPK